MSKMNLQTVSLTDVFCPMVLKDVLDKSRKSVQVFLPVCNPGKQDDYESWGSPWAEIPPEFVGGFDASKGSLLCHTAQSYKKAFGRTIAADAKKQRAKVIQWLSKNSDDCISFRFTSDKEEEREASSKDRTLTVTFEEISTYLQSVWTTDPQYWVVAGQRRTWAWPLSELLRKKLGHKEYALQFLTCVRDFKSLDETAVLQLRENAENARRNYSEVGLAVNAIERLRADCTLGETDLGRLLGLSDSFDASGAPVGNKRGQRQKFYRLAKFAISQVGMDLDVLGRIQQQPTYYADNEQNKALGRIGKWKYQKGGFLPVSKMDKEGLATILGTRKEPTNRQKVSKIWGENGVEYEKTSPPTIAISVRAERWFANLFESQKGLGDNMISKTDLQAFAAHGGLQGVTASVVDVINAILLGDKTAINALIRQDS